MKTLLALAITTLSACATSSRASFEPIGASRDVDVAYGATLEAVSTSDAATHAGDRVPGANAEPGPKVELDFALFAVRDVRAASSSRDGTAVFGRILAAADAERLTSSETDFEFRLVRNLVLEPGRRRTFEFGFDGVIEYVSGFALEQSGSTLIGDPRVATCGNVVELEAMPELVDDADAVDLAITVRGTKVVGRPDEIAIQLPGGAPTVTIQIPIAWKESLTTRVRLAPDEALVLGSLTGPGADEELVAIVRARRAR